MERVCSWCERRIGRRVSGGGAVSHVLCGSCLRELLCSVQRGRAVRGSGASDVPGPLASGTPAEAA
jgi:hypothetical protein